MNRTQRLRSLPAVDDILRDAELADIRKQCAHATLATWVRDAVDRVRQQVLDGLLDDSPSDSDDARRLVLQAVRDQASSESGIAIQSVINATGIILHTNLGRAPLANEAIERIVQAAGYSNVELDLHTGKRNHRGERVNRLLKRLTGAEDAIVVNNCAAATLLVLQALAGGREVIVARGQLVEIGGGFRLPDVFRAAGVVLREVGTTNRTYLHDYEAAINDQTGAIIRVHHSNFRMSGFVTEPTIAELVSIQRPRSVVLIDDLGSGWLRNSDPLRLSEPTVRESVAAGADLTLFSGDKLLGGPQCGIIVGRTDWITKLRKSPLARALRVDKLTIAAMEATLELHLSDDTGKLPVIAMLSSSCDDVRQRCIRVCQTLGNPPSVEIIPCQSQIGGGSVPGTDLPSFALRIQCSQPDAMAQRLRQGRPAVQPRIQDGALLFDLRTVGDDQCDVLSQRIGELIHRATAEGYGA